MASAHAQRLASIYTAGQLANAGAQNAAILNNGYAAASTNLQNNATQALGALGSGYDAARDQYGQAETKYQPWVDAGTNALGTYENSLGLNGASGNAAAVSAYQASPGYQAGVDAATDAVARKASALGVLGSGNTMQAISTKAQDLQNQDYSTWQGQLNGLSNTGLQASGAQANLTKGIGDLDAAQGAGQAGIYTGLGSGLAGIDTGLATNLANTNMQVATGQGAAVTNAAQATDAAKNANSNLLLGALGLGLKGASMFSGGLGSLGSLFGGGTGSGSQIINGVSYT